jgi:drug/metabolite transporter (DMT)-like permease
LSFQRTLALTASTMIAFAGNSLLCRVALKHTGIDAATFTFIRLASGALVLWMISRFARYAEQDPGNWISAFVLFAYAAGFSFAYLSLPASTGALLLFGAVQATMIGHGLWAGERLSGVQVLGLFLALGGLVGLLLPGLSAPQPVGSALMLGAGVAWGIYSLRGRGAMNPTAATAGNFLRAVPFAVLVSLLAHGAMRWDGAGACYAVASGAVTSGLGYAIWYSVLPSLQATTAATVQLSVPVIAALGGVLFLAEPLTGRLLMATAAILGGIGLVILVKRPAPALQAVVPDRAAAPLTDD